MRLLIISDTHGDTEYLSQTINRHQTDIVIHLGDAEISRNLFSMKMVRGNSPKDDSLPSEVEFKIDNQVFFMTHGHKYDVNNGLNNLFYKAKSINAKYCFFGHTHIALYQTIDDITFINPGSLTRPRSGYSSYMILDTETHVCILYNTLGKEILRYDRSN